MPRRPPPVRAPSLRATPRPTLIDLRLAVVTPMFGGGAEAGHVDHALPIHGSSVRGQLRFWWRACRAHTYSSVADLYRDEAALWGATANNGRGGPSAIDIDLTIEDAGTPTPGAYDTHADDRFRDNEFGYPSYALFPFQANQTDHKPPAPGRRDIIFRLRLSPSISRRDPAIDATVDLTAEATAAVWAWITFGGVGARTRRGCGTLFCLDDLQDARRSRFVPDEHVDRWIVAQSTVHCPGQSAQPRQLAIPWLSGGWFDLGRNRALAPIDAWRLAVEPMRQLRQGAHVGREGTFGRSLWPEADAIRHATGTWKTGHDPRHPGESYFPRAELGLPIVFKFKNQDVKATPGDPDVHTLQPGDAVGSRMASPIILKALPLASNRAVPMALRLNVPGVAGVLRTMLPNLHLVSSTGSTPIALPKHVRDTTTGAAIAAAAPPPDGAWRGARPAITELFDLIHADPNWGDASVTLP